MSVLLDAGPVLNFLAVGQQNVLVQVASTHGLDLAVPERVDRELRGMARSPRFERTGVLRRWTTLTSAGRVKLLDDSLTSPSFAEAVARVSGRPKQERVRDRRSLGEILVIAHASMLVQKGVDVFILIDDRDGRERARREAAWLRRAGYAARLVLWSTPQLLKAAGERDGWIVGGLSWMEVYERMRPYDDGLPPTTDLR